MAQVRGCPPSTTALLPRTGAEALRHAEILYIWAFPNNPVRRQAIPQEPCWTLAYVFSELHTTDIDALFFLYISLDGC